MATRNVQAGRGVEWLSESVSLILKNPSVFLLMALLVAVISAVPVLGGLALLVLGPTFYAGFMSAARSQEREGRAEFQQLFDGFQEGRLPRLLALCLPAVAAVIVLAVLAVILIGGAILGGGLSAASGNDAFAFAALGGSGVVFVLIALGVGFVAHALVFFAVPRVMFDDLEPFTAMKESWRTVLANIGAVLVFLVLVLLAYALLMVLVGWIDSVLAQVLIGTLMVPLVAVAVWRAYRDVFGEVTQEAPVAVTPPPPSSDRTDEPPPPPAS